MAYEDLIRPSNHNTDGKLCCIHRIANFRFDRSINSQNIKWIGNLPLGGVDAHTVTTRLTRRAIHIHGFHTTHRGKKAAQLPDNAHTIPEGACIHTGLGDNGAAFGARTNKEERKGTSESISSHSASVSNSGSASASLGTPIQIVVPSHMTQVHAKQFFASLFEEIEKNQIATLGARVVGVAWIPHRHHVNRDGQ